MTTERRYTCNLCRDRIVQDASERGAMEGTGILFGASADCSAFRFVRLDESENHICGACIASIRRQPA